MARGSVKRKEELKQWLLDRDTAKVIAEPRVSAVLLSLMFDNDVLLRWRTIEALGEWARRLSANNMEKVREILRRLFWAMNDESGGFIWMAPQAVAYILRCVPALIDEYGLMLISKLREEPFAKGVLWSAWFLSSIEPKLIAKWQFEIKAYCQSDYPEEKIYACSALLNAGLLKENELSAEILDGTRMLEEYDFEKGEILPVPVSKYFT